MNGGAIWNTLVPQLAIICNSCSYTAIDTMLFVSLLAVYFVFFITNIFLLAMKFWSSFPFFLDFGVVNSYFSFALQWVAAVRFQPPNPLYSLRGWQVCVWPSYLFLALEVINWLIICNAYWVMACQWFLYRCTVAYCNIKLT